MTTIAVSEQTVDRLDKYRMSKGMLKSGVLVYETNEEVLKRLLDFVEGTSFLQTSEPHKTFSWNVGRKEKLVVPLVTITEDQC